MSTPSTNLQPYEHEILPPHRERTLVGYVVKCNKQGTLLYFESQFAETDISSKNN